MSLRSGTRNALTSLNQNTQQIQPSRRCAIAHAECVLTSRVQKLVTLGGARNAVNDFSRQETIRNRIFSAFRHNQSAARCSFGCEQPRRARVRRMILRKRPRDEERCTGCQNEKLRLLLSTSPKLLLNGNVPLARTHVWGMGSDNKSHRFVQQSSSSCVVCSRTTSVDSAIAN